MPLPAEFLELGLGGGDKLHKLAVVVPCYINVSSNFLVNFANLINNHPEQIHLEIVRGPYVAQSMRQAAKELLKVPDWERVVVIEQDMILPNDGLLKHALHTDDIVGSVYFQHSPPYQLNVFYRHPLRPGGLGHPQPHVVRHMLENPALYKCDGVGLGCTSIARRVFEQWPADVPTFRNEFSDKDKDDTFSGGEVSHDVWFCQHARDLGFDIYLDTSIQCAHLTEGWTSARHYLTANPGDVVSGNSKIVIPTMRRQKEQHVSRYAKAH